MYKGCRHFVLLAAFFVGLGVLGGANEVGAIAEVTNVSISSPDSGVVRGIDSVIVATVDVFDIPKTSDLTVVMYLVTGGKDTVVTETNSVGIKVDVKGKGTEFREDGTVAEEAALRDSLGELEGDVRAALGITRTSDAGVIDASRKTPGDDPQFTDVNADRGLVAVRKVVNFDDENDELDDDILSTDFIGNADSVTTRDITNGTQFTWYLKVSAELPDVKKVRVAAFVMEQTSNTPSGNDYSGVEISPVTGQIDVDAERPRNPVNTLAFYNADFSVKEEAADGTGNHESPEEDITAGNTADDSDGVEGIDDAADLRYYFGDLLPGNYSAGKTGIVGFSRDDATDGTTVLGIGDTIRMQLKLGDDVSDVLRKASLGVGAVVFGKTFPVDTGNRLKDAQGDVVKFDLILPEDAFGSSKQNCCAGVDVAGDPDASPVVPPPPSDTLRFVYIDGAGNQSGEVDAAKPEGVKALVHFMADTKRPVIDATKGDTLHPASDSTISDGTLNSGFSSDSNAVSWILDESLDSLIVKFEGADVDVELGIIGETKSVSSDEDGNYTLGGKISGKRYLDFTSLGGANKKDGGDDERGEDVRDIVQVLGVIDKDNILKSVDELADKGTGKQFSIDYSYRKGFPAKSQNDALLTGTYDISFRGRDLAGNSGPETTRTKVYVDVDDVDFIRLFPTKAGFGDVKADRLDTLEEETAKVSFQLSEPADSVLITYTGITGPDAKGVRSRRLSGTELTNTATAQLFPIDSLEHGTMYTLTVLARDMAGNFKRTRTDSFVYDTTHLVPTIKRFTVKATRGEDDKLPIGLTDTNAVTAGGKVALTIVADATTDGSRDAVTYRSEAILKVSIDGSEAATTGVALEGTGVTDMGGGRAMLSALDWVVGTRTVTLTDTAAIETLSVSIIDSSSADGPFAGALDSSIVVNTADFNRIVVSAPDTVTQGEDFWVSVGLGDKFGNPRLKDNRYVSISSNKLGVQVPAGDHLIAGGTGGFTVNSGTFAGGGLVISVRDIVATIPKEGDPDTGNNFEDGQSPAIYVQTPGEVIVGTTVDRPDTLIVEDYMGADGAGDQGGFLVLTWDLSDNHTPGGAYRIYREVHVNYAPAGDDDTTGAAVVELDSPAAVPVPWAKIDMVPKEDIARAIVATLDNVASMWFVAAEVGGATSAKHAFADVAGFMSPAGLMDEPMVPGIASRVSVTRVSSPYELMAEAMVASKQAGLVDPDAPVFATLTPEALAYAERGVGLRLKDTGGDVQSSALTPSAEAVAAIDNIPPEPITNLRVMDTPGDAGASIDVVWTKSSSDRLVPRSASGAIGLEAVSDIVPGVVGYNVYRKLSGGEFTPVGMTDAGVTALSDVTALNGVRYTYQVSSFDLDNETVSDLERTAMAIRNNVVDKSGSPIYGLFGPDQSVGFDDFFIFADFFGLDAGSDDFDPAFDLSRNNKIDFDDFFVFADNFGRSVEVSGKAVPVLAGLNPEASLFLEAAAELPRVGEEMVVDVGLADFAELKAYGFTVNYDADRLEFVKVLGGAGILGETELAQPHIVAQGDGEISLAAYGQIVDKGELDLSLVFRPTMEIEDSRIYFSEGQLRDGNYGVNQVARLGEVQIQTRPEVFALADNYPNPFNPETTIKYALPEAVDVRLDIYNMLGQMVRTMVADNQSPGRYVVRWDATDESGNDLSTGIYFYRLRAGDFLETKKMLLLK